MIKNRTILEIEISGRELVLECPQGTTWEDIIQACDFFKKYASDVVEANKIKSEEAHVD